MVSLQAEGNYWFHYEDYKEDHDNPSINQYVPAYSTLGYSPYEDSLMINESIGDSVIEEEIRKHVQNGHVAAYLAYPKRFSSSDRYSLFIPLESPLMDEAIVLSQTKGYAHDDYEKRAQGQLLVETLLKASMVPFLIHPFQLQDRQVTVDTNGPTFYIGQLGYINQNPDVYIKSYQEFPNATVYYLSREIQ